jgi:hypothetical protein
LWKIQKLGVNLKILVRNIGLEFAPLIFNPYIEHIIVSEDSVEDPDYKSVGFEETSTEYPTNLADARKTAPPSLKTMATASSFYESETMHSNPLGSWNNETDAFISLFDAQGPLNWNGVLVDQMIRNWDYIFSNMQ